MENDTDKCRREEPEPQLPNMMQKHSEYIDTALKSTSETEHGKRQPYLPPCRICNGPASGFHYGVNTCEACKGFFRRSLARKVPYICESQQKCRILLDERNSCPSCRYGKCIASGMSRQAIKTGRYTHEKRTLDTHEIKSKVDGSESFQPCLPVAVKDEMMISITDAFRSTFHDSCLMYEHTHKIQSLVRSILKKQNMESVDRILHYNNVSLDGNIDLTEDNPPKPADILTSLPLLNTTLSGDMLLAYEVKTSLITSKNLFEVWTASLDKYVKDLVSFFKTLPNFHELALADQITLIKAAHTEITAIIRHKHFDVTNGTCVDYQSESGSLIIFPLRAMTALLLGCDGENAPLHTFFLQSVTRMNKLDFKVPWLALTISLALFSPDREGLSNEAQAIVSRTQLQIVSVLEYAIMKNESRNSLVLPKLLMLLVDQRYNNNLVQKALRNCNEESAKILPPILKELWSENDSELS